MSGQTVKLKDLQTPEAQGRSYSGKELPQLGESFSEYRKRVPRNPKFVYEKDKGEKSIRNLKPERLKQLKNSESNNALNLNANLEEETIAATKNIVALKKDASDATTDSARQALLLAAEKAKKEINSVTKNREANSIEATRLKVLSDEKHKKLENESIQRLQKLKEEKEKQGKELEEKEKEQLRKSREESEKLSKKLQEDKERYEKFKKSEEYTNTLDAIPESQAETLTSINDLDNLTEDVMPNALPLQTRAPAGSVAGLPVSVATAAAVTAAVASGATFPSAPLRSVKAEPHAQTPLEAQFIRFGFGNEGGLAPQVFSLNDFVKKTPQGSPIPDPPDHMSPLIGNYNEFKKRFVYSENKEEEDKIKEIMFKYWKAEGPSNNEVLYHKHTISEPEENNFKIPDDNPSNKDDRKILINIFKFYKEFVGKRIHDGQNSEGRNSLMSSAYRIQEQRIDNYLGILLEGKPETFIIKKEEFDGSDDYYSFLIKMFWILKENAKRKGNGRINMKDIISGFKTSNISKIGDDYYNSANTQTTGGLKLRKGIEDLYALLNKLELENEKAEKARLAAERETLATEAERLAAELEAARVAAELEAARLAEEAEAARLAEAERARLAEAERARLAAEAERARLAAEADARKRAAEEAQKRLQQEQTEQQRLQQERLQQQQAEEAQRLAEEQQRLHQKQAEEARRRAADAAERLRQERLRLQREREEEARRRAAAPPRQRPASEEGVGKINKDWIKYLEKTGLTKMKQYRQKASLTPAKLQQIKSNWQSQGYRTPSEGYIVPLIPEKRTSGKPFRFYKNSQNYNFKDQPLWSEGQKGGRTQMSEENNALHSLFSEQLAWEDLTKEYDSIESEYQSLLPEPGESPLHRFLKNFHVYIDENSYQELLEDADGYVELMRPELVEDLYDETQEKRNEIMRRIMPFYKRAMPHLNDSQVSPVILAHLLRKNIF